MTIKPILFVTLAMIWTASTHPGGALAQDSTTSRDWQTEFNISQRAFTATGESAYFVLVPGYQLVLEGGGERVTITVLDETREIIGITTRVVEERSEEGGELTELARNFFAMDQATGDVFYFGEDVDIYEGGRLTSHEGSWLAGRDGDPGLMMSGAPAMGMKYYQEVAPGVAQDRAEVTSTSETVTTPAGVFENSVVTIESSGLDAAAMERKVFAPGIGLVESDSLRLVSYGYIQ